MISVSPTETDGAGFGTGAVVALVVLAVAFNLFLLTLAHVPATKELIGDERYYFELADALARGDAGEHAPFWPPGYALALTGVFRVVGAGTLAVQLVQVALWLGICLLWYRLAVELLPSRAGAVTTLAVVLFAADLGPFAHYLWPEVLHLSLVSVGVALLVLRRRGTGAALAAGVAFGMALLSKVLLAPLVPVFAGMAAAGSEQTTRARCAAAAALLAGIALPLAPVAIDNAVSGRPVMVSSATFNLWVGLNDPPPGPEAPDIAGPESVQYREAASSAAERNAIYQRKIRDKVVSEGPLSIAAAQLGKQYFRLFDRETFFVEQLPGGDRTAYGFRSPWLAAALRLYAYVTHAVVLAGGAFGLAFLGRRAGWPHVFAGFLVYNVVLFAAFHATTRFVVQMVPVLAFFAGAGVSALLGTPSDAAAGGPALVPATSTRVAIGIALAALVLFLAFRSLWI